MIIILTYKHNYFFVFVADFDPICFQIPGSELFFIFAEKKEAVVIP